WVDHPQAVAVDAAGRVYIADTYDNLIRKVDVNGVITTIAGTGNPGYSGDGGPATSADLYNPASVCIDTYGNVYFPATEKGVIRKVDAITGIISVYAGTGTPGFSGDGGPAVAAQINCGSITIDAANNIYFADSYRIRKINPAGIINTIAGNGTAGYSGDNGPAISARISAYYFGFDSAGNLYLTNDCTVNTCVIRKINTAGIITTIAGTTTATGWSGDGGAATSAGIGSIFGMSVDQSGNIYLSDAKFIRKISVATGIMDKIAGTGVTLCGFDATPALSTGMNPYGLCTDNLSNVYYADYQNDKVRVVCQSSCLAGVEELKETKKIAVYPNPATSILHFDDLSIPENSQIEITNTLGQIVLKQQYSSSVEVSTLAQGYYNIKISAPNKEIYYSKFIKE
ncbi:MAG: T9SS type A sorting domain-containing protein, partial [Bacteroidia bacterium]